MRRFGRQTVWCTVSLLRRVLREASWQANDRSLTDEEAEKRFRGLLTTMRLAAPRYATHVNDFVCRLVQGGRPHLFDILIIRQTMYV